jgi:hypothetical protein
MPELDSSGGGRRLPEPLPGLGGLISDSEPEIY